ncbi:hypothetical protein C5469_22385 [Photorhabdus cinerea]|uniref:Uncharacterized protein n=1 Tax=Photorhabdus cinerea TaxID=471575 RepID=A0A7X5TK96_9GAMM|nr:hypothetical protein [Photorhabdus cinerea]
MTKTPHLRKAKRLSLAGRKRMMPMRKRMTIKKRVAAPNGNVVQLFSAVNTQQIAPTWQRI